MADEFKIQVLDQKLVDTLNKLTKELNDLTIPLTLIIQQWLKSNVAIFSLKSPGKYADFKYGDKSKYKKEKIKKYGFAYPLLKAQGMLERSLTQPGDPSGITKIINKQSLLLGSKEKTAKWHQFGTKYMAARPVVLVGAEQTAPQDLNKRREAWIAILEKFVKDKTKEEFSG